MLDVERGEDVDARGEHVLHVVVALGMREPGRVGVRELVDQAQLRRPGEDRRQVHLLQRHVPVDDAPPRHDLEPGRLRGGVGAAVRLEVADHDVAPVLGLGLPLLQHPVGLADARGHAEEHLVAPVLTPRAGCG